VNPPKHQSAAILLAAGFSSRMGRPKPLLEYRGETFLDRQIDLYSAMCAPVLVVLGAEASAIAGALRRAESAVLVLNPRPERGQLSSLKCGLRALPGGCDSFFFMPVDSPGIAPETLRRLLEAWRGAPAGTRLVIPRVQGKHGHPVLACASLAGELLGLGDSASARDVVHSYRERTLFVDVEDRAALLDIDDADAYRALVGEPVE